MSMVTEDERDPVEELAEVFLEEVRAGQDVTVDGYAQQYPQFADRIQNLFPTLLMMEKRKPRESGSGGAGESDPLLGLNVDELGDFKINRRIGRGGMGIVYEATQQSLGRRVALKVLAPSLFTTAETVGRFQREARAAATLHHSNIVPVFSVGDEWGVHYYAMQYIDGPGLDQVLNGEESSITIRNDFMRIAELGGHVASALHYAHQNGTLHRDIKPANLLIGSDGTIWVTDFGLAKLMNVDDGLTTAGQAVGTMRYMPPEQFSGQTDQRGDVYSLGLSLYEVIAWRPAFQETTKTRLMQDIARGDVPSLRSVNPDVPKDLETIVLKAVATDPNQRYQTAEELADDLQRFRNHEPIRARRLYPWERLARWTKRNPAVASLGFLAATLLCVVAIVSTIGYVNTNAAYRQVEEENARTSAVATLATSTLENIFDRFAPDRLDGTDGALTAQPVLSNESAALLQSLLVFYEELSSQTDSEELLLKAAEAQSKVARIHEQLGDHELAVESYRSAIERYGQLGATSAIQLKLASAHNHIGQNLKAVGKVEESEAEHVKAIDLLHSMTATNTELLVPDDSSRSAMADQLQFELARSLYLKSRFLRPGLGPNSLPDASFLSAPHQNDLHLFLMDPPRRASVTSDLKLAVEFLDELADRTDAPDTKHLLAMCLFELAPDAVDLRNPDEEAADQRAIDILKKLTVEFPHVTEYQYSLLDAYTQIDLRACEHLTRETLEELRARFSEAMTIGEKLSSERSDVALYTSTVAQAAFKLAMILEVLADSSDGAERRELRAESERYFRRATSRQATLAKRYPHCPGYQVWLAGFQIELSRVEHHQHQLDQAHVFLARAIRIIEKLPSDVAKTTVVRALARRSFVQLGLIMEDRGRRDRADFARELAEAFGPDGRGSPSRDPLGRSWPAGDPRGESRDGPGEMLLRELFPPPPHQR